MTEVVNYKEKSDDNSNEVELGVIVSTLQDAVDLISQINEDKITEDIKIQAELFMNQFRCDFGTMQLT